MQIVLEKPELAKFVEDQVKAGRFSSAAEVIEAGLSRLMDDSDRGELDDATLDAIEEGNAQLERGEGIDFRAFAERMRQKLGTK